MTQREAIPDTPLLTASADDSSRAPGGTSAHRAATRLAWALWALTLLLLIGYILLRLYWYALATAPGSTLPPAAVAPSLNTLPRLISDLLGVGVIPAFATLGALIVARARARARRIGWIYCAVGLAAATDGFCGTYAIVALLVAPGLLPAGLAFAWIQSWTWIVVLGLLFVFLPLLFPTGRLLSRRWRPVAVCTIGLMGGGSLLEAVAPEPLGNNLLNFPTSVANPLGIPALRPVWEIVAHSGLLLLLLLALLAATSLLLRLRRARGEERERLKWFAYAAALLVVWWVTDNLLSTYFPREAATRAFESVFSLVGPLPLASLPLLTGLAILKYRLFDIDLLINRTLVYGALSVFVVGLYALIVGGASALFGSGGNLLISLIATGVAALLFQPLRGWLQRGVNRLTYGQRDEPYAVVAQLGRRLESTLAPEAMLPAIIETVAQALKLPYAAIALKRGDELQTEAIYGTPVEAALTLPLVYQAETIGQFTLGPRQRGETFTPADQRLLEDLARQIGVAAHAVQLTADLQRSRERLVTTREEERRRLRRDLHDGLGPALGGLLLKLDALGDELRCDPAQAALLLSELKGDVQAAVADVRRLVYALRPPALDELGLVGALRLLVTQYQRPDLHVDLDAPDALPPLLAAAEVAVYRIVQEALTNVVRHAQASACAVSLAVRDGLEVSIRDNGQGMPAQQPVGVGLLSMRERATELGGECALTSSGGEGTVVRAWLPLTQTPLPLSTTAVTAADER
jgi:signal transduction histidine kinase